METTFYPNRDLNIRIHVEPRVCNEPNVCYELCVCYEPCVCIMKRVCVTRPLAVTCPPTYPADFTLLWRWQGFIPVAGRVI